MIVGFEEFLDFEIGFRREGVGSHPDLADTGAKQVFARLADGWRDHDELDREFAGAGDDNLFPAINGGDKFGEAGLVVMDVDFYTAILAKMVS